MNGAVHVHYFIRVGTASLSKCFLMAVSNLYEIDRRQILAWVNALTTKRVSPSPTRNLGKQTLEYSAWDLLLR